jgi:hypothetical protein
MPEGDPFATIVLSQLEGALLLARIPAPRHHCTAPNRR